jgi:hypothetical protein
MLVNSIASLFCSVKILPNTFQERYAIHCVHYVGYHVTGGVYITSKEYAFRTDYSQKVACCIILYIHIF